MLSSIIMFICFFGGIYLFLSWLTWHEAAEEQRTREAKFRHPTNKSYPGSQETK